MNSSHEILHDLSNRRFVRMHSMKIKPVACFKQIITAHTHKKTPRIFARVEWEDEPQIVMNEAYACERNVFASKNQLTVRRLNIVSVLHSFYFFQIQRKKMTCLKWIAGKTKYSQRHFAQMCRVLRFVRMLRGIELIFWSFNFHCSWAVCCFLFRFLLDYFFGCCNKKKNHVDDETCVCIIQSCELKFCIDLQIGYCKEKNTVFPFHFIIIVSEWFSMFFLFFCLLKTNYSPATH